MELVGGLQNVVRGCAAGEACFKVMLYTRVNEEYSCSGWPLRRHRGQEYRRIRLCTSVKVRSLGL